MWCPKCGSYFEHTFINREGICFTCRVCHLHWLREVDVDGYETYISSDTGDDCEVEALDRAIQANIKGESNPSLIRRTPFTSDER